MSSVESYLSSAHNYTTNRQYDQALRVLVRAVQQFPAVAEIHHQLGLVLAQSGKLKDAKSPLERAIALVPQIGLYHINLGRIHMALRDFDGAERHIRDGLALEPRLTDGWIWLAELESEHFRYINAIEYIDRAISYDPGRHTLHAFRARMLGQIGDVAGALSVLDECSVHWPDDAALLSARCCWANYAELGAQTIFEYHQEWGNLIEREPHVFHQRHVHWEPDRRLHVAFLSQDFRRHSVAYFMQPFMNHRDRNAFEVSIYYDLHNRDQMTDWFEKSADHFANISPLSDQAVVNHLEKHHVDILVDLSGHTSNRRWGVYQQKAAPVQVTYLGYPNTTGLHAIDARIVDEWTDPIGSETLATETLVRLPSGFLCYSPPEDAPAVNVLPAKSGSFTFGSLNALAKIQPKIVRLWCEILKRVPGSKMILKDRALGEVVVRDRVLEWFEQNGVSHDRLELLSYVESIQGHLSLYHKIDLALDTFPYHGTTTTCEAMWMGVPTLSLIGDRHASRVGLSLHHRMKDNNLDAFSEEEFVSLAVGWTDKLEELASIRAKMRQKMTGSGLVNGKAWTEELESALRQLWLIACEEHSS